MKLFKSYTFAWWQMAILKLALLSLGAAIGSYWYSFFGANLVVLIVIAIISSIYILSISFRQ